MILEIIGGVAVWLAGTAVACGYLDAIVQERDWRQNVWYHYGPTPFAWPVVLVWVLVAWALRRPRLALLEAGRLLHPGYRAERREQKLKEKKEYRKHIESEYQKIQKELTHEELD